MGLYESIDNSDLKTSKPEAKIKTKQNKMYKNKIKPDFEAFF